MDAVCGNGHYFAGQLEMVAADPVGRILAGLMKDCVKRKKVQDLPMPVLMSSMMGVVALPTLMAEPFARVAPRWAHKLSKAYIEHSLLTDKALEQRVDLALRMLKREEGARA